VRDLIGEILFEGQSEVMRRKYGKNGVFSSEANYLGI